jgi:hypothetical protein
MDVTADPPNPGPGDTTTLIITASGNRGSDKYGIKDVKITLKVTDSPGSDAKVDPASVTTDASGTATSRFTTSRTKGPNVISASAGTLTSDFNVDTLLGSSGTVTRGRHQGSVDPVGSSIPQVSPMLIFALAAMVMLVGFALPVARRTLRLRLLPGSSRSHGRRKKAKRPKQPAVVTQVRASGRQWGPSSPKKSRG